MPRPEQNNTAPLKPGISLCMIAKDEQANLARCIQSAAPWVDEIILVDTGSSDGTVELAWSLGAKVIERPWQHDFALHRNQSLEEAGREWMFFMDADEELDREKAAFLRKAASRQDCDLGVVEILHLSPEGGHTLQLTPRLLRKSAGIRFEGRIHEKPVGAKGLTLRLPVRVIHHGFVQSEEVSRAKAERNLELIRAWLADDPNDPEPAIYLAQSLMVFPERSEETLMAARSALALAKGSQWPGRLLPRAYHPLFMALTRLGRHAELMDAAKECLEYLPDYPDPHYSLTWAAVRLGLWQEVCGSARRFAELQEKWQRRSLDYPYPHNLSLNLGARVMKRWALSALMLGDRREFDQALALLKKMPGAKEVAGELADQLRTMRSPAAGKGAA